MGSVLIYQYCSDPTLVHTLMWQLAAFEMREPIRRELEDDQIRRKGMCGLYLQNEHQQQLRYYHTLQQGSAHVWGGVGRAWTGVAEDSHLTHFTPTPHLTSPPTYLPPSPSTHKPCPHLLPSSPTSRALTWLPLTSTFTFHPPKSHPHLYPHLPSTQLPPTHRACPLPPL